MTLPGRLPTTLGCQGTEQSPHDPVTWLGTWVPDDETTNEPSCWVCGEHPYSTPPRYPYRRANGHAAYPVTLSTAIRTTTRTAPGRS